MPTTAENFDTISMFVENYELTLAEMVDNAQLSLKHSETVSGYDVECLARIAGLQNSLPQVRYLLDRVNEEGVSKEAVVRSVKTLAAGALVTASYLFAGNGGVGLVKAHEGAFWQELSTRLLSM